MKTTTSTLATGLLLAGLCGLAATAPSRPAAAQSRSGDTTESTHRAPGKVTRERERRLVGTIESIDKASRAVVLVGENGRKETFTVPSTFEGFDRLKVGERVNVVYKESIALGLGKPGEKAGVQTHQGVTETPTATGRAGERTNQIQATAEVVSVDVRKHELTFKGPEGNVRTVTVDDPDLRDKLADIKPGDTLQLTYTEAIAGSITPAKKK